ncbi:competence type IV pilus assembly protein ComGB [Staphylococcus sp. SQ8-PEA]|uniref:Competence type IV pilus assembly protein ComGB n=1 Tax=Staphylococcus marylandisciuri TaxID=2981529 RepID=A0ABT2QQY5_9STAP|nr:competence type IV pilus assembly protein ComGB [Staphylococcus marylandisciuri]MCU5746363.1 competence type IV pilus assembly protein ComGB [Staphylococcus marylandisciuri]
MKKLSIDISKLLSKKPLNTLNQIELLKRLADLLAHGFTLTEAFQFLFQYLTLKEQSLHHKILDKLEEGESCTTVLSLLKYPKTIITQVYFSEKFGELLSCLNSAIEFMEQNHKAKQQLLKTLQYPIVLLSVFIVMLVTLNQTVIPEFQHLYATMDVPLSPFQTFLTNFIKLLPPCILLSSIFLLLMFLIVKVIFSRMTIAQRIKFSLQIPIYNSYYKLFKTYRLANEFSLFYRNGVNLNHIVNIYTQQQEDTYLHYLGYYIATKTEKGVALEGILAELGCFESELITFIAQGQKKGKLEVELKLYSSILISKIERLILKHLRFIQPTIFTLLALLIVSLYLVIMLPMFELMQSIK